MSEATDDGVAVPIPAFTEWKVRVGFGFALACLGVVGIVSYLSVVRLNENAARVEHTREVLGSLELLLAAATDSETAERGYVITGDESYLGPYRDAGAVIDGQTRQLRELTADNRAQQQRLDSVVALVTDRLAILRAVIELRKDQGFAAAQGEILAGKGKQFHDRIRRLIGQMEDTETSLLKEREQLTRRSSTIAEWVIIGGGVLACGLVALAQFTIPSRLGERHSAGLARYLATGEAPLLGKRLELSGLRADCSEVAVELSIKRMPGDGPPSFAGFVRDLTEREQAAEMNARLAAIIASSDDAIASKNLEGIITSWNLGAERLFGYSAQEALGKPMAMLIPPERSSEEPAILARIARGESTDHFETVRIGKDGRKIDVSVTISPLRDSQGRIIGASKIARDITDRRLGEAKVQAQLARLNLLQQITRAIGERQDIQSIFQVVIRTLEEHLPVDFCCICLYDPAENCLIVTSVGSHSQALSMELAMTAQARIEIDRNGLSHCVNGQLVYEPDITQVPFAFPRRLASGALRSMVAAPLLVESKVFGVLIAARQQAHSFSSA